MPPRPVIRRLRAPLFLALAVVLTTLPACGGDDDDDASPIVEDPSATASQSTTGANDSTTSPMLAMPASRYSVLVEDLGIDFITDIAATFPLTADDYAKGSAFASPGEGTAMLRSWNYTGGYETGYTPEGREKAVLNGGFYSKVETHLFGNEDGAKKAFTYLESRARGIAGNQPLTVAPIGNQSAAFTRVSGKVAGTAVNAVYHQFLFRRGNLVAVVLTYGAEGFMKVDSARDMAYLMDLKALGKKNAIEPTPTSNFTPAATQKK